MRTVYRVVLAGLLAGSAVACSDKLAVTNPNNPDEPRALARPTDVENLIIGSYNTQHGAVYRFDGVNAQILCLGMENYSNLANSAMGIRSTIPRPPISNTRNATGTPESYNPWLVLHRAARAAALGLNRVNQPTFTFFPTSTAQSERAKAFAHFVMGISMGQIAMVYDSGSAISDLDDLSSTTPLPLIASDTLARYALARLDSAVRHIGLMGTQTIPAAWMSTTADLTAGQFKALVLAWKARIMAGSARAPGDAIVNWDTVLNDAGQFLTGWTKAAPTGSNGDVVMAMNPASNWDDGTMNQLYQSSSANWHEMHGFMVGFADTSTNYAAWLNNGFLGPNPIATPDLRWPQGGATCNVANPTSACRTAQQAAPGAYFENRASGSDWFGEAIGNSQYRLRRLLPWFSAAGRVGPVVIMSRAEMYGLMAEAYYMKANYASAAGYVDSSRTSATAGLPAVTGVLLTATDTLTGTGCTPHYPKASGSGWTPHCATLWEALKYEKRMETAFTYMGTWYFDGRRWGDLPQGTAASFPVPYQESDARNTSNFYSTGGSAPKGTYGL